MDKTFLATPRTPIPDSEIIDPVAEIMAGLPLPAIHDDELFACLAAEGFAFETEGEAIGWADEIYSHQSRSHWSGCGHARRCSACPGRRFVVSSSGAIAQQTLHHLTGEPLPPEHRRLCEEAFAFRVDHKFATPWLQNYQWFDDGDDPFAAPE